METLTSRQKRSRKHHWSKTHFAWVYAFAIFCVAVLYGFLLKINGVYESVALRSINMVFILFGFIKLIHDYTKAKNQNLSFVKAFLLNIRTGVYYLLMYIPFITLFLLLNHRELNLVKTNETFNSNFSVIEMAFSSYIESFSSIVICSITAAFSIGFFKRNQT